MRSVFPILRVAARSVGWLLAIALVMREEMVVVLVASRVAALWVVVALALALG